MFKVLTKLSRIRILWEYKFYMQSYSQRQIIHPNKKRHYNILKVSGDKLSI